MKMLRKEDCEEYSNTVGSFYRLAERDTEVNSLEDLHVRQKVSRESTPQGEEAEEESTEREFLAWSTTRKA